MVPMSMFMAVVVVMVMIPSAHDPDTFQQLFCRTLGRTTNRDNSPGRMDSLLFEEDTRNAPRDLEIMAVEGYAEG